MNETVRYNRESYKYQEESHLKVICNVGVLKWFFNLEKEVYYSILYITNLWKPRCQKVFRFHTKQAFCFESHIGWYFHVQEGTNKSGYKFSSIDFPLMWYFLDSIARYVFHCSSPKSNCSLSRKLFHVKVNFKKIKLTICAHYWFFSQNLFLHFLLKIENLLVNIGQIVSSSLVGHHQRSKYTYSDHDISHSMFSCWSSEFWARARVQ